jgi:AraC-like DNA-binding protein
LSLSFRFVCLDPYRIISLWNADSVDRKSEMPSPDRLSSLIAAFSLRTEIVDPDSGIANLLLLSDEGGSRPRALLYRAAAPLDGQSVGNATATMPDTLVTAARIDFGGAANPLVTALPDPLRIDIEPGSRLAAAASLFADEAAVPRCGRGATLDRLCEVMVVLLLRDAIEAGATTSGLLAGLADPRLHRSLAAIHDDPGGRWSINQLAEIAGMSRSHFLASFRRTVGRTPTAYLTAWRLTLARQDLRHGETVKAVAGRYGFGSTAALSRAFARQYGHPPSAVTADGSAGRRPPA